MMRVSLSELLAKKARGEKISMLTCYDYPTAVLEDEAGVDIVFVGDSVGTNVLGYQSEQEVTMADMLHHLRAVRRGVTSAYLLVDMPYGSHATPELALDNARTFVAGGADGVKIEAAQPETVKRLVEHGIQVCAHLGMTPQTDNRPGLRAKTSEAATALAEAAFSLETAGAALMLFETIPDEVAGWLTEQLKVPTIGIGSGARTDGQVLVVLDLLGASHFNFRHNRKYADVRSISQMALKQYVADVRAGSFPAEENLRHMAPEEFEAFASAAQDHTPSRA